MNATTHNLLTQYRPNWARFSHVFSPTRLRLGYRAIRSRCANDVGFKRACVAAVVANCLLALVCPPLGLLSLWLSMVHVMPRKIL